MIKKLNVLVGRRIALFAIAVFMFIGAFCMVLGLYWIGTEGSNLLEFITISTKTGAYSFFAIGTLLSAYTFYLLDNYQNKPNIAEN